MENNFKVMYSPEFYDELNQICSYIRYKLQNKIAANNLLDNVERKINDRLKNPTRI